jgi:hypothetical protein
MMMMPQITRTMKRTVMTARATEKLWEVVGAVT